MAKSGRRLQPCGLEAASHVVDKVTQPCVQQISEWDFGVMLKELVSTHLDMLLSHEVEEYFTYPGLQNRG